jgi:polyhydroxyalkanoate synthase
MQDTTSTRSQSQAWLGDEPARAAQLPQRSGRLLPGGTETSLLSQGAAIDRVIHALWAKQTGGVSPIALWLALADWAAHLASSPGKQMHLAKALARSALRFQHYALNCAMAGGAEAPCVEPAPSDKRFRAPEWQTWPFNIIHQGFLLQERFLDEATRSVRGVTKQHENVVNFTARQALDMLSPSNFAPTNPEVLQQTAREGGWNLVRGALNFMEDAARRIAGDRPAGMERFRVGETLAVTPGKVVFRNDLIELIQYAPSTGQVRPEPILIVPAWIMKYYILDLSPHNSLIKYLVGEGFTVFAISWKNPDARYRDYGMDHYRRLGMMAALDEIGRICSGQKVHAAGYCLGGTLLAIAASAMARDGDQRLKTVTFFAAQTDFTEAGELELFVSESELAFLEEMMQEHGVLEGRQMAATFQLLRSNDLIWSRWLHDYLMGKRQEPFDLMAWNADVTRMPARMHSDYLRHIFFENQLAHGQYMVEGRPIALSDIRAPIFSVATEWDHVAPWKSVYTLRLLTDTAVTFLLTNGGHNAGIVSEPGRPNRVYRIATSGADDPYVDPATWYRNTPDRPGSWWPEWSRWLAERSGEPIPPPPMGNPLCEAPGTYVFE